MVQELLPFFPQTLTSAQALFCLLGLVAGLFLWVSGAVWSRGLVTLVAVTLGALLGMYVPRWQLWPINSMALAVLGAVGFGLSAYLVERLWMGLTFGFVLACWAALGTWVQQRPADFVYPQREAWQLQHMTPPEHARDLFIRLPAEVRDVLPYAAGTAMLSGLAVALLWPRLGRAVGMSTAGVTMVLGFALALVMTRRPAWLAHVPAPPLTQAGIAAGMVMVGLLGQWPFLRRRDGKQDDGESGDDGGDGGRDRPAGTPAAQPRCETPDRQLARMFS